MVDGNGNIYVVGQSEEDLMTPGTYTLMLRHSSDQGQTFSNPVLVATAATYLEQSQMIIEPSGAIDIAMQTYNSASMQIAVLFARSTDGSTFTVQTLASAPNVSLAGANQMVLDSCGVINLVYSAETTVTGEPQTLDVFLSRSADGVAFITTNLSNNAPFAAQAGTPYKAVQAAIAADKNGNVFVTWEDINVAYGIVGHGMFVVPPPSAGGSACGHPQG